MLDEKRIRQMTKLAFFEKKEEKNRLQFSWNACDCAGCFSPSGRTDARK